MLKKIRTSCPFSCRESVNGLCADHVKIVAPVRTVASSCGGEDFDYPAARAGHTMTAIGPSALMCGGYSPVIPFAVSMDIKCFEGDAKVCTGKCGIRQMCVELGVSESMNGNIVYLRV